MLIEVTHVRRANKIMRLQLGKMPVVEQIAPSINAAKKYIRAHIPNWDKGAVRAG